MNESIDLILLIAICIVMLAIHIIAYVIYILEKMVMNK